MDSCGSRPARFFRARRRETARGGLRAWRRSMRSRPGVAYWVPSRSWWPERWELLPREPANLGCPIESSSIGLRRTTHPLGEIPHEYAAIFPFTRPDNWPPHAPGAHVLHRGTGWRRRQWHRARDRRLVRQVRGGGQQSHQRARRLRMQHRLRLLYAGGCRGRRGP